MLNLGHYTFWSKQSEMFLSALCNMMQRLQISSKVLKEQLVKISRTLWLSEIIVYWSSFFFFGVKGAILFSTLG